MIDHKLSVAVYTRDNWKCRHCNSRAGLHPHHLVYKSKGGEDVINNLITLCFVCHEAVHNRKLLIILLDKVGSEGVVSFKRQGNWKPR
jgi:5-methylcytosine-specific restriction endonuclease McrA